MSGSQLVRTAPRNNLNYNNPTNLLLDVKPSRILTGVVAPLLTDGSLLDYYIDTVTGNFYSKDSDGIWNLIYNFGTMIGTGVTDLNNLGSGAEIFTNVVAGIANLRTLTSNTGKITFLTEPNDISLGVSLTNADVGLDLVRNILNEYNSLRNPNAGDDGQNYSVGSFWWNESTGSLFFCQSSAHSAAVWIPINVAASGFLTNCANLGSGAPVFSNVTGTVANFRSIASSDTSVFVSTVGNNINLQVPSAIPRDVATFGFASVNVTQLLVASQVYSLQQTWIYDSGVSRGTWSVTGTPPYLNITRPFASSNNPPYYYNVSASLQYTSNLPDGGVTTSQVTFYFMPSGSNSAFPAQGSRVGQMFLGSGQGRNAVTSINTVWNVFDNNEASFYILVFSNTVMNIININTQVVVTQI